uniref:Ion_trans_2 domain-containing protein n=1 Tax=Ascaris lumbricoides TaxID=6252 RepID=A0A0M3HNG0_ASCLU
MLFEALLSRKCEKNAEKLDAQRTDMLNVLWAETMAQSEHEWAQMANNKLDMYERALLASCSARVDRTNTYSNAFLQSFSLITTIGFVDADALTTGGKIFAIAYAIFGIPLALLYLGQCSKIVAGLLPGDRVLAAAFSAIFLTAIIYDIAEDSEDDTVRPFIDAVFHTFLFMTTVGKCGAAPNGILVTIALIAMSVVSISFVVLERHIESSLQGFEMAFTRQFASLGRWLNSKATDNDRIIEEEDEETEDSECS